MHVKIFKFCYFLKIIDCLRKNDEYKYFSTWRGWFEISIHKISLSEDCGIKLQQVLSNNFDRKSVYKEQCNKKWISSSTQSFEQSLHNPSSMGSPWYLPVSIRRGKIPHLNWARIDRKYLHKSIATYFSLPRKISCHKL